MQVTVPPGMGPGQQVQVNGPSGPFLCTIPQGVGPGYAFQVAVPTAPVVTGTPHAVAVPQQIQSVQPASFMQPAPQIDMGGSQDFLSTIDGVFVRQQLELLELISGCETKNRYNIVGIPQGTQFPPPGMMNSTFTKGLRDQAGSMPLLKAKEESECFERICCPLFRGLQLPMKDGNGNVFLNIDRPCVCDPCYAPPSCACFGQEMTLKNGAGVPISKVKMQPGCYAAGCCATYFHVKTPEGAPMYSLRASDCNTHAGSCGNCCAPTCCNESYDIDIYGPDMKYITTSAFVFPGCNCGGLTDLSNFTVQFPAEATADERASLLGAMFLIEFTVNEFRRQNNNNNNGGGGGGSPPVQMMAR
uniref:Phospholipid scramblase n=1 Tax=Haptolina ericina TaxID=156174 RepID=A0A7S3AS35_9EUKA